jgi:cell division protein FtsL
MNRRRRQKFNPINAPALARWIVIFVFLAVTGLSYVYLTVQLHSLGTQRRQLERQLADTRTQIEDARVQIATLTSHTALQQRLREGYLKMVPISEQSIVRLNLPLRPAGEEDVQPVSNKRGAR